MKSNIYTTENEVKLKIKLIVSSVEKKHPEDMDEFGYPLYVVQSTNAIVPTPPKEIKKR